MAVGHRPTEPIVRNYHALDALASTAVFPPAAAFMLTTTGTVVLTESGLALAIGTAVGLSLANHALLSEASGWPESGGSGSEGESGSAGDFESTGYSRDDLASMTYRHTGSGDLHIGGSQPRPSEPEILDALTHGTRRPIDGQNAVQYVLGRVKVIVNRDMPWQSTGYYRGG